MGELQLSQGAHVELQDAFDNAPGDTSEALYVNSLVVPAGTTLDLGGLALYTRAAVVQGSVIGGTITLLPDSGPIVRGVATFGGIATAGEIDEWTFFSRAGQSITAVLNPGGTSIPAASSPVINFALMELLDSSGSIVASVSSSSSGALLQLANVELPGDGVYRLRVRAPLDQPTRTGNYALTLWDATIDESRLALNEQQFGTIENPLSSRPLDLRSQRQPASAV